MEVRLPSGKELIVLEMLINKADMYGLEMVRASAELKRGTVYVLLSRMEEKGFVKSKQVDDGTAGLPLRVYSITGLGARAYRAWQASADVFRGFGWQKA